MMCFTIKPGLCSSSGSKWRRWSRVVFAPQGLLTDDWGHFWLSQLGAGAAPMANFDWPLVGRGLRCWVISCNAQDTQNNKLLSPKLFIRLVP